MNRVQLPSAPCTCDVSTRSSGPASSITSRYCAMPSPSNDGPWLSSVSTRPAASSAPSSSHRCAIIEPHHVPTKRCRRGS
jgi:hypothetical protein